MKIYLENRAEFTDIEKFTGSLANGREGWKLIRYQTDTPLRSSSGVHANSYSSLRISRVM